MTPKQACDALCSIADKTEASGQVPVAEVMTLLARLEAGPRNKRASVDAKKAASAFRKAAEDMQSATPPSPGAMANWLRNVLADQIQPTSAQIAASIYQQASSREDVMDGFSKANPHMTKEQLEAAADNWEKHQNVVKDKHQG